MDPMLEGNVETDGFPSLRSLYMYISGSCNLACRHCWINPDFQPNSGKGNYLDLKYVRKAIVEAKTLGLSSVKLTGGEPLLHPEFREIIQISVKYQVGVTIETNGILISREISDFLKMSGNMRNISVSLDGACQESHDELRGVPGAFKQTVEGILNLGKAGIRPQMICTIHKGNQHEIWDIIRLAINLGCSSIKFNHIQTVGRGEFFAKDAGISVEEAVQLFSEVEAKCGSYKNFMVYFDIPMAFYPIRKLVSGHMGHCNVFNILGILPDGTMSLCGIGVTSPDLVCGNLENDSVGTVWKQSDILNEIRKQIPDGFKGICGNCIHKSICLGSCIAANYYNYGSFDSPNIFCETAANMGIFPDSRRISRKREMVRG